MRTTVVSTTIGPMLMFIVLAGCAAWTTPAPGSRPYFTTEPHEFKSFQSLARKQEDLISRCIGPSPCDHIHFTRALLGLYESREIAEKYFKMVMAAAPKGKFAASSAAWLQLLQQPVTPGPKSWPEAVSIAPAIARAHTSLAVTADRLVRDLLDREMDIQQLRSTQGDESETVEALHRELEDREQKIESLQTRKESGKSSVVPVTIQSLQKQLAERDRKIEELSAQLDALKRIDQEMREKVRPIRPPLTTVPVPGPETTP
jgi:phage shock protein A